MCKGAGILEAARHGRDAAGAIRSYAFINEDLGFLIVPKNKSKEHILDDCKSSGFDMKGKVIRVEITDGGNLFPLYRPIDLSNPDAASLLLADYAESPDSKEYWNMNLTYMRRNAAREYFRKLDNNRSESPVFYDEDSIQSSAALLVSQLYASGHMPGVTDGDSYFLVYVDKAGNISITADKTSAHKTIGARFEAGAGVASFTYYPAVNGVADSKASIYPRFEIYKYSTIDKKIQMGGFTMETTEFDCAMTLSVPRRAAELTCKNDFEQIFEVSDKAPSVISLLKTAKPKQE